MDDVLLTKADAARILGVTPAMVARMDEQRKLPSTRTANGTRIFRKADVEALAAKRAIVGRRASL